MKRKDLTIAAAAGGLAALADAKARATGGPADANLMLFTPPRPDDQPPPNTAHAEREVSGDVVLFRHSSGAYIRIMNAGDVLIVPAKGRRVSVGEPFPD